ncbi:MAG: acyl-CoA dehydrogenase [Rhodospirillaceae bacterium]|nr:acyl-CoA dehydrogenase [Rhodospirillaceae bacterium]|tara:strand:+ start:60247 stop:62049 length:1803 start_codon:yes stop_codon:yes gene_type:complete
MPHYSPPIDEVLFTLNEITAYRELTSLSNFKDISEDLTQAVLKEAGKLASGPIADINQIGDKKGATLENGSVKTAPGFPEAYKKFVEGGWNGISFPEDIGGQNMPFALGLSVNEFFTSANMAFSLCPLLTSGAVEAISAHASESIKKKYLSKLVSGEWTGTMNLTEPQAGSDVGSLTTKAIPNSDGSYNIFGTKIYITYGDHDLAENIIHLVLARTPDSPKGTKGISLFLVPKFFVNDDGVIAEKNDLRCGSLERKLGIHASPTAVMLYGETQGAKGWLIGQENQGMRCMFTMMNHARIDVGVQGLSIAERAYQQALEYAFSRKQGKSPLVQSDESVSIIEHPDVKRMILDIKSKIDAMRGLILTTGVYADLSKYHSNDDSKKLYSELVDLLTPIVKSWCTDIGFSSASTGLQVHGGMGFIEETGAAQHLRDSRIAPIYEGTNGIQALDLVFRKLSQSGGKAVDFLFKQIRELISDLNNEDSQDLEIISELLEKSMDSFKISTEWISSKAIKNFNDAASSASIYLDIFGILLGSYFLSKAALKSFNKIKNQKTNSSFYKNKIQIARFFAEQYLPRVINSPVSVKAGGTALGSVDFASFGG